MNTNNGSNNDTNDIFLPIQVSTVYEKDVFDNGDSYEGEKLSGDRHGKGKYTFLNYGYYDGYWRNNLMHGRGTLYYESGERAYDG